MIAIAYFDSSVVLAILREEPTAAAAMELWKRFPRRVSSRLWAAECTTVLRRAARSGLPGTTQQWYDGARKQLAELNDEIHLIDVTQSVMSQLQAIELLGGARTLDAIHLATALGLRSELADPEAAVLCTFDRTMSGLASSLGFTVLPRQEG